MALGKRYAHNVFGVDAQETSTMTGTEACPTVLNKGLIAGPSGMSASQKVKGQRPVIITAWGNAPGWLRNGTLALKGRAIPCNGTPFQGFAKIKTSNPGALPQATMERPVGA